jgi:acetate---CoA ligase (ADP-forming)
MKGRRERKILPKMKESSEDEGRPELSEIRTAMRARMRNGTADLGEAECRDLLSHVVRFGAAIAVNTVDEAEDAAIRLGYPVVCKRLEQALAHKSELGFVRLGLRTGEEVRQAAKDLLGPGPGSESNDSVLSVQRQLHGVEVSVGVTRDSLGTLCVVAAGGTLIELIDDSAAALGPVSPEEALGMIRGLKVARMLEGYRGLPPVDLGSLAELVSFVSELAAAVPEIAELEFNPVFVSPDGVDVADVWCALRESDHAAVSGELYSELDRMMSPKRIAVIGASSARLKVGGLVVRYLRKHGYDGDIIAVNPRASAIEGARVVASLGEVDEPIDLACIAVPYADVEAAVAECVQAGIPNGIIYSSGFAESGPDGADAQERLVTAAGGRFRFVGPNSMGVAALGPRVTASFGMALEADELEFGQIGLVSQSGAIASALFSRARELEVGFSHWIGVGNEADLGVEDFMAYLAEDDSCQIVCLFLEVIRRPEAFAEAARRLRAAGKPIVAFKTGVSELGRLASSSHTGAMSSEDDVYSAFFRQNGVIRVGSLEKLFVAARGISMAGALPGNRAAIVSMSGGACSILSDLCAVAGIDVPELDTTIQARLEEILPSYASTRNPVDITATGIQRPELVEATMTTLLDSGAVDVVLLQFGTNSDPSAEEMANSLIKLRSQGERRILISRLGAPNLAPRAVAAYRAAGAQVFSWPDELVAAAAACLELGRNEERLFEHRPEPTLDVLSPT